MAAPTIIWKRGQTFAATGPYVPGAGDPIDLTGVTIESEVQDHSKRRYPLEVTIGEDNLTVTLYSPATTTAQWDIGTAAIDLRCVKDGIVFSTTTVRFVVEQEVTLPNG
jgi:hypothetical protein